ncbi:hypothetical protein M422DRAFT_38335 [Sphaerobolus stellatus SS14]|uniref:Uncharacterized protein n=1 Tax=Sphaerobolus stellatus (strain SS14) TaxID=990650 RepID=A0A0C9ULL7_SPHS4|nr:hypothetical protein M422DRAFT_38335 [Sphaerobolus stellatus SS14]
MTTRNSAFGQNRRRQHAAAYSAIEIGNTQHIRPLELQTVGKGYVELGKLNERVEVGGEWMERPYVEDSGWCLRDEEQRT